MIVLLSNISTPIIEEAISESMADEIIFIHNKKFDIKLTLPYKVVKIDEKPFEKLKNLISSLLDSGKDVRFALYPDATSVEILNAAKEFDQFKKINMYIVKDGSLEQFKACLC